MSKNLRLLLALTAMSKFTHIAIDDSKADRRSSPCSDRRDYSKPDWAEQGRRDGATTIRDRRTITGPNAGGRRHRREKF